jgi:hypothetical protein
MTPLTTVGYLLGRWGWTTGVHQNLVAAPVFGGVVHNAAHTAEV